MLKSFTRNYEDNSTDAGFQFTFYCDICNDGYKSSFVESQTYKKGKGMKGLSRGIGILGNLVGGRVRDLAYGAERGGDILSERFEGMSPEWQKEVKKPLNGRRTKPKSIFTAAIPATNMSATPASTRTRAYAPTARPGRRCMWQKRGRKPCAGILRKPEAPLPSGKAKSKARPRSARSAASPPEAASSATTAARRWR